MKSISIKLFSAVALLAATLTASAQTSETRKVSDFHAVAVGGAFEVHIKINGQEAYQHYAGPISMDITDKDPQSPISSHAFVTRKTGTRIIMSAGIREAIEEMLTGMEGVK